MTQRPRGQFCGRTRREFLWQAGGGFGALPLVSLLANDGQLSGQAFGDDEIASSLNPLSPKPPHFAPKAKSVIFLFMYGGPSHIDTFDYKPDMYGMDGKTMDVKTFGRGGKRIREGSSSPNGSSSNTANVASGSVTCFPTSQVASTTSPSCIP